VAAVIIADHPNVLAVTAQQVIDLVRPRRTRQAKPMQEHNSVLGPARTTVMHP
jgi:hypothetical protein